MNNEIIDTFKKFMPYKKHNTVDYKVLCFEIYHCHIDGILVNFYLDLYGSIETFSLRIRDFSNDARNYIKTLANNSVVICDGIETNDIILLNDNPDSQHGLYYLLIYETSYNFIAISHETNKLLILISSFFNYKIDYTNKNIKLIDSL